MEAGGAQRVMSLMANHWVKKGWQVTLISLSGIESDFYQLDPAVNRVGLDLLNPSVNRVHAMISNFRRLFVIRRVIKTSSPDVIISFMDKMNVLTLLSTLGSSLPVLVSERIDPRKQSIGQPWTFLRDRIYPTATKLVVQTKSVLDWASGRWPTLSSVVIHNPAISPEQNASSQLLEPEFKWFIGVGRLVRQKGFDLLIEAFSDLVNKGMAHNWRLIILGEGEERRALERQVESSGLAGWISMPGEVKNLGEYLLQSDVFVLSSRYEGFPNALLEAMSSGLAVVSTDCPTGPNEIIQQNLNGILVENNSSIALAGGMSKLMQSQKLRDRLSEGASKSVSRFGLQEIMTKWEEVIEEAIKTIP